MMFDTSALRRLAHSRTFRRWAITNLFARLPLTMNLLSLVLVGEAATGSLATGAQLAGVATVTSGLLAVWRGRMLDRDELRAGLRRHLLATAAALALITVATATSAPVWVLFVLAAAEGVAFAAVLGGFRALLVPAVSPEELEAANALDAVFVEVAFVAGPAAAGILALLVGPIGMLTFMVVSLVLAAALLGGLPPRYSEVTAATGAPPYRVPGAGSVYLLAVGVGATLGILESTVPLRVEALGMAPATAGPLLACTAFGSGLAGLVASAQVDPLRNVRWRAGILMACYGALFVPVAIAGGPVVLAVALFAVGLPIAPLNAVGTLVIQRLVPRARQAEGFALLTASILVGAGLGQGLAGSLATRVAPTTVFLAAAVLGGLLGAVALGAALRRRRLGLPATVGVPPSAMPPDTGSPTPAPPASSVRGGHTSDRGGSG